MIIVATVLLCANPVQEIHKDEVLDLRIKSTHTLEEKVKILEQRTDFLLKELSSHAQALFAIRDIFQGWVDEHDEKQK